MNINTRHQFKHICYDVEQLFNGVSTLSKFMKNLEKQSELYPDRFKPEKYKGDAFESLVECLILLSPIDKRINCIDYVPTSENEIGVDGVGKTHDGNVHCVQMKYRSNTGKYLTEEDDHIATAPASAAFKYDSKKLTIYTTAADLNFKLKENWGDKVSVMSYREIKLLIDNNLPFWEIFKKSLLTNSINLI